MNANGSKEKLGNNSTIKKDDSKENQNSAESPMYQQKSRRSSLRVIKTKNRSLKSNDVELPSKENQDLEACID